MYHGEQRISFDSYYELPNDDEPEATDANITAQIDIVEKAHVAWKAAGCACGCGRVVGFNEYWRNGKCSVCFYADVYASVETVILDGYVTCNDCDKFAHVTSAEALKRMPDGYSGELCQTCNLWMCSLDKLTGIKA